VKWNGKRIPGDRFVFEPQKPYRRGAKGVYEPPRTSKGHPGHQIHRNDPHQGICLVLRRGGGVSDSNPEFATWTGQERSTKLFPPGGSPGNHLRLVRKRPSTMLSRPMAATSRFMTSSNSWKRHFKGGNENGF